MFLQLGKGNAGNASNASNASNARKAHAAAKDAVTSLQMSFELKPTLLLLETEAEFYEFLHEVCQLAEYGENGVRYAIARSGLSD